MGEGIRIGLDVAVETLPRHTVLRLAGEVDLAEVAAVRRAALAAVASGRDVVVDLGEVTFVDACGLATIVAVRRAVRAAGLACAVVAPSRVVRRVAALTRSEAALGWDLPARRRSRPVHRRWPSRRHEHPLHPRQPLRLLGS